MAENIFKVYPGGDWHNESEKQRYVHVITALERYANLDYDWLDFQWHIKNAVIGNIFFSDTVFRGVEVGFFWPGYKKSKSIYSEWIGRIMIGDTLLASGVLDESLLKIREKLKKQISNGELRFEHMIPAKVYLNHLYKKYLDGSLDLNYFHSFRQKINVCIVTKEEDSRLKRDEMPKGWNLDIDSSDARYKEAGIKIHNWPIE